MLFIAINLNTLKSKIAAIMVVFVLFIGIFGSYQKAHALAWFLLAPAAAEAAYVGTMAAVFGGAAVATAGIEYLDENLDTVEATARETWGLMSADMKENFMQSMAQVEQGGTIAGDFITGFFDSLAGVLSGNTGNPVESGLMSYNNGLFTLTGDRVFKVSALPNFNSNTLRVIGKQVKVHVGENAGKVRVFAEFAIGSSGSGAANFDYDVIKTSTEANELVREINGFGANFGGLMGYLSATFGISVSIIGADGSTVLAPDMPTGQLDNLRNHVDDLIANGGVRLGVNPSTYVEPWANTATGNARVYENEDGSTDTMVLPDGVPIPRDQVNWRTRATGQATIDGVSVPVVVGADGALYDTRTGERVVSREDAQSRGIPVSPAIDREWTWQDTLTKNPAKEETKDDTTTKPADLSGFFAKLWEWLQKILNAILAIPKAIIDALKTLLLLLFVPTDGFWTDNFSELRLALTDKLGADELIEDVEQLGSAGGGSFTDVTVSLLGVSGLTVIDADSVNGVLDYIHKWVRGVVFPFLLFYNINQLYKLIRGTSLVEATRNMNRVKGD